MNPPLFERYPSLRIAVVGDFCLDRYLEIDPARAEISIETGLPVHNVVRVRSQPGGAGTILNNLAALGVGHIHPVGFCGYDGEGYELLRALGERRGVDKSRFVQTAERRTFTYCKPLVINPGQAPRELNRLDSKNWTPTPPAVRAQLADAVEDLARTADALILLDQVDVAETGVVTRPLLERVRAIATQRPDLLILADSRRGLQGYPPVCLKMNGAEFETFTGCPASTPLPDLLAATAAMARSHGKAVFVSLSERGIIGAAPAGDPIHVPSLPVRGEIDIVGAGDAVTANLTAALGAGADMATALRVAMAAASIVIHQLGTTGAATPEEISQLLASR